MASDEQPAEKKALPANDEKGSGASAPEEPKAEPVAAESVAEKAEASNGATEKAAEAEEKPAEAEEKAEAAEAEEKDAEESAASEEKKPPRKPRPALPAPAPLRPQGWGTTAGVVALLILVGGVLVSVFIMRKSDDSPSPSPAKRERSGGAEEWKVGQKHDVTITVLPTDAENLECAHANEVAGKHCAFENKATEWSKAKNDDDKLLLRPYATTGKKRIIAAGFWSQLAAPLPEKRFSVKCTFEIEGKLEKPFVRFKKGAAFKEVKDGWFAGNLAGCKIAKK